MGTFFKPVMGILVGRSGTTAEKFIHDTQVGIVDTEVRAVVSLYDGEALKRMQRLNKMYDLDIYIAQVNGEQFPDEEPVRGQQKLRESDVINDIFEREGVTHVGLMGYPRKVTGPLFENYGAKPRHTTPLQAFMFNNHPAPLPETQGLMLLDAQRRVFELGLGHTALNVHAVGAEYDTGMIFRTIQVPLLPGDTPETAADAVQSVEKAWTGDIYQQLFNEQAELLSAS